MNPSMYIHSSEIFRTVDTLPTVIADIYYNTFLALLIIIVLYILLRYNNTYRFVKSMLSIGMSFMALLMTALKQYTQKAMVKQSTCITLDLIIGKSCKWSIVGNSILTIYFIVLYYTLWIIGVWHLFRQEQRATFAAICSVRLDHTHWTCPKYAFSTSFIIAIYYYDMDLHTVIKNSEIVCVPSYVAMKQVSYFLYSAAHIARVHNMLVLDLYMTNQN